MGAQQLVACRVAGCAYAFRIASVREIIRDGGAVPVAAGDPVLLGVVDLRGAAMPVLDLARALGLDCDEADPGGDAARDARRIVVTTGRDASDVVGWLVDGVDEVISVADSDVEQLERAASDAVRCVARAEEGRLLPVLDVELLLRGAAAAA